MFALSPGVQVTEKDLTSIIPAVSSSTGACVGNFAWGPVLEPAKITSENELVSLFGAPTSTTFRSFFTAANFLGYTNSLYVNRVVGDEALNATNSGTGMLIKNRTDYEDGLVVSTTNYFIAKYPGLFGNNLSVSIADSATFAAWAFKGYFNGAPGTSAYAERKGGSNDELHIVVIDKTGEVTGTAGTILEKFEYVSKASDGVKTDGTVNYYLSVINIMSKYLWAKDKPNTATDNWFSPAQGVAFDSLSVTDDLTDVATGLPLTGGAEGDIPTEGEIQIGWDLYNNADQYDISMLLAGAATPATAKYVVQIAESRRDCLAFVSAATATGEPILDAVVATAIANTVAFRTDAAFNVNSSFCVMDSGWKYQYDRYCDLYRWVPLNADIAGLCARTDYTNDPWWSPGGLNRGQIKNVIKLNVSPNQSQRDTLYQSGVNPVVSFAGMGTVLYGDKTLLTKPSAFDRINVRRLFIVLEKAIAIAAKYQLFEFNDAFTRAQFKSMVDPFLRDVQGRRGIYDFRVVCNENNNTGEVIDRNEFIADIFIKPARSINFLTLNFIASRTSVSFEEIGG